MPLNFLLVQLGLLLRFNFLLAPLNFLLLNISACAFELSACAFELQHSRVLGIMISCPLFLNFNSNAFTLANCACLVNPDHVLCYSSKSRVLGIPNMPHLVFVSDSNSISLSLAYSFRMSCSMKSSFLILSS